MPEQMREPNGHVTVNEHVPTEKFSRFVEEKVQSWMSEHHAKDGSPSEYEVAFFDEDVLGEVSCLIVIHCGGQLWRAWESGDTPRAALAKTIESLAVDDEATSADSGQGPMVH